MMMKLPAVLREYRHRYPNVEIVPHAMPYPEHIAALRGGTIDIAWSIAIPEPDIASRVVRRDAFLVVLPDDHPLAPQELVDLRELHGESLVVISRTVSPVLYDDAMASCLTSGLRPPQIHEAYEEESVLGLVAGGFGFALVPFAWSRIGVPGVAFRRTSSDTTLVESLIWHNDRSTPMVRAFIEAALAMG
jgi:DNA-binding transcriptional LysR family regulator